MNAVFTHGGIELRVISDGQFNHPDPLRGSSDFHGHVGLHALDHSLDGKETSELFAIRMAPSQARALASAILSAATEVVPKRP